VLGRSDVNTRIALFAAAALTCCLGIATPANAVEIEKLAAQVDGGTFLVRATVLLDAPRAAVEAVLTDFENHVQIAPFIQESHVLERSGFGSTRVRVVTRTCIGPFCSSMLQVQQVLVGPCGKVTAEAIPYESDVSLGRTVWDLQAVGWRTRASVEMIVHPRRSPPFFIRERWILAKLREQVRESAVGVEAAAMREPTTSVRDERDACSPGFADAVSVRTTDAPLRAVQ
jgi:hypothetical protein